MSRRSPASLAVAIGALLMLLGMIVYLVIVPAAPATGAGSAVLIAEKMQWLSDHWNILLSMWALEAIGAALIAAGALRRGAANRHRIGFGWAIIALAEVIDVLTHLWMIGTYRAASTAGPEVFALADGFASTAYLGASAIFAAGIITLFLAVDQIPGWLRWLAVLSGITALTGAAALASATTSGFAVTIAELAALAELAGLAIFALGLDREPVAAL